MKRLTSAQLFAPAAHAMGLQARIFNASHSREINDAFTTIARDRHEALLVGPDPYFVSRRTQLVTLAARHAIPVREYVEAGGLMSYGTNAVDAYRQVGLYAGRILKGAKPADLPVVQASKFELVINLATAMMLGLEVPPTLLARADEVIE
jgi:putative ABC transport system substrate-binding protein